MREICEYSSINPNEVLIRGEECVGCIKNFKICNVYNPQLQTDTIADRLNATNLTTKKIVENFYYAFGGKND